MKASTSASMASAPTITEIGRAGRPTGTRPARLTLFLLRTCLGAGVKTPALFLSTGQAIDQPDAHLSWTVRFAFGVGVANRGWWLIWNAILRLSAGALPGG